LHANKPALEKANFKNGNLLFDVAMTSFLWDIYTVPDYDTTSVPSALPEYTRPPAVSSAGPRDSIPNFNDGRVPAPARSEPPPPPSSEQNTPSSTTNTAQYGPPSSSAPTAPSSNTPPISAPVPAPSSQSYADISGSNIPRGPPTENTPMIVLNRAGKGIENFWNFTRGYSIIDRTYFEMTVESPENAVNKFSTDGNLIKDNIDAGGKIEYNKLKDKWEKSAKNPDAHTFRQIIIENAERKFEKKTVVGKENAVWSQAPKAVQDYIGLNEGYSCTIDLKDSAVKGATLSLCNSLKDGMTEWKRKMGNWAGLDFGAAVSFNCPSDNITGLEEKISLMRVNKNNYDQWIAGESLTGALAGVIIVLLDLVSSVVIVKLSSGPEKMTPPKYGLCWRLFTTVASLTSLAMVQALLRPTGNYVANEIIGMDPFNPLVTEWAMFNTVHYLKLQVRGRIASYFMKEDSPPWKPSKQEVEDATQSQLYNHLDNLLKYTGQNGYVELSENSDNLYRGKFYTEVMRAYLLKTHRWPAQSKTERWQTPVKNYITNKFNAQYGGLTSAFQNVNYKQLSKYSVLTSIPVVFAKSAIKQFFTESSSRMFVDAV